MRRRAACKGSGPAPRRVLTNLNPAIVGWGMAIAPYRGLWSKAPLLGGLDSAQVARVGALIEIRHLDDGQVLFLAGDPCDAFYIVLEGTIRLLKPQEDGGELLLNLIHPGQSFAEAALFAGGAFPATARAMSGTLLARVPRSPFLALLRSDAELCLRMLGSLAAWHHRLTHQVQQLRAEDAGERLRAWLMEEAARNPAREVLLRVPKKQLAAQLGMTPETLSRQLGQLRAQGLVEVDGPRIRVLQP